MHFEFILNALTFIQTDTHLNSHEFTPIHIHSYPLTSIHIHSHSFTCIYQNLPAFMFFLNIASSDIQGAIKPATISSNIEGSFGAKIKIHFRIIKPQAEYFSHYFSFNARINFNI